MAVAGAAADHGHRHAGGDEQTWRLVTEVEPDGIVFDAYSIEAERITEDADYEGIRIRFLGQLERARIHMQVDIGFGDVAYPEPARADFPAMLGFPAPRLLCYSRESSIAEKLEAMVKLGALNSRMKDFYDLWALSRQFDFDGVTPTEAVRLTFERRGTGCLLRLRPAESFIESKGTQWTAFRKIEIPPGLARSWGRGELKLPAD
jgi:hypothetical protein